MNFLLRPTPGLVSLVTYLSSESRPYQNGMFHIPFFSAYLLHPQLTTNSFQSISWPFIQMLLALGKEKKQPMNNADGLLETPLSNTYNLTPWLSVAIMLLESKLSFQLSSYLTNHPYLPPLSPDHFVS